MTEAHEPRERREAVLETRSVDVSFGGFRALEDVDLTLWRGEALGLIGANGAGKTTLVNVISGFQKPTSGTVLLGGRDITRLTAHERARRGLGRTFQGVRLFGRLTVADNIEVAGLATGQRRRQARQRCGQIMAMLGVEHLAEVPTNSLSYGDSQRVGIGRALATGAKAIMVDEAAAGMNEGETQELLDILARVREREGIAFLVIEHNVEFVMRLCDRVQVLAHGKTICVGSPEEVRRDPQVIGSYLGTEKVGVHA